MLTFHSLTQQILRKLRTLEHPALLCSLVETVTLVEELGDVLDIRGQQLVLNEILDALEMTQSS